ncbi:MAG: hypothetical protein R3A47_11410 [Polyangiales bacterium]
MGARILTPAGWAVATMHVPERESLVDFLNSDDSFFRLTNVSLPNQHEKIDFVAMHRRGVLLVVPGSDHLIEGQPDADDVDHVVTCLFDGGMVMGSFALPPGKRVSDVLMHQEPFFALYQCTIAMDANDNDVDVEQVLLVHTNQMYAIAEV